MSRLALYLLGPPRIELDGEPVHIGRRKVLALLAYLTVEGGSHRRDTLAALFWPEYDQSDARADLRRTLSVLRRVLGKDWLLADRETVGLHPDADPSTSSGQVLWLDVHQFRQRLAACDAHGHPMTEVCSKCVASLEEAVGLYRDDFMAGFTLPDSLAFDEWQFFQTQGLRDGLASALERLVRWHGDQGQYEAAIAYARRWLALDPLHEPVHQHLMALYARAGQQAAALRQYQMCERTLAEELDMPPSAETQLLYARIRDGEVRREPSPSAASQRPQETTMDLPGFLTDAGLQPGRPVFVARERELGQLDTYLERALASQGQVVFITGGPGRGKTALLIEFARRAMEAHPGLLVGMGNCNTYSGIGDPYLPFREALGMLTGDLEAHWAAGAITRDQALRLWKALPVVVQALLQWGPHLADALFSGPGLLSRARARVGDGTPWLGQLKEYVARLRAGAQDLESDALFHQTGNMLRALAQEHPLLLTLDDLQWVDPASAGLLFHLGRRLAGARILIVGAYRPEELAADPAAERHPLRQALSEFQRLFGDAWLDLSRIEETESRRFVEALLDSQPNRLDETYRRALAGHTEGHPLFTVELLRAMQASGDLVQDETGHWVQGHELNWKRLPARMEGVIAARVDRLDGALRELLTVASVEGERFTAQVVAQVQGLPERQVLRALSQELEKRHRLVREEGEVTVTRQRLSRFRFGHALFQSYLYNSLSAGERRLLHRDIGDVLEALFEGREEEIAGQLAHHAAGAGEPERERRYARLAGERAATRYANHEACHYFNHAIDLTPETDFATRYDLVLSREKVYDLMGERDAQEQDLKTLQELAETLNDDHKRALVALRRANYAEKTGDYSSTTSLAQEAVRLARVVGEPSIEAAGHLQWGRALWRQGSYHAARRPLEKAQTLAQTAELRQVEAESLRNLGVVSYYLADYAIARAYYERAWHIYREIGDRRGESAALNSLGLAALDRCEEAMAFYEQALRIKREIGDRMGEATALIGLGAVFNILGAYAEAKDYFEQSLLIFREIGNRMGESHVLSSLGQLLHQINNDESACEYCQQGLLIAQELEDRSNEGYLLTTLGHALVGLGELMQAAHAYQQAHTLRRQLGQNSLAIESLTGLARVRLAQGNLIQAIVHVDDVLEQLATCSLDGTEEPLRIYLTCFHILQASDDLRADEILETAHSLLQERAAKIDDERLRRSFLENVAVHREIQAEWQDQGF